MAIPRKGSVAGAAFALALPSFLLVLFAPTTVASLAFAPLSYSSSAPRRHRRPPPSTALRPSDVVLGEPIGNGTFGTVLWGALAPPRNATVVAKYVHPDAPPRSQSYLNVEARLNARLCLDAGSRSNHVAPYLGSVTKNRTKYLVWEKSGTKTLQDYIDDPDSERSDAELSNALDVPHSPFSGGAESPHDLPREVLHQLLLALSYVHSLGVVHRDVKPANVLVDPESRTLRLIDFGSAADMASWTRREGYRGAGKGPRSILYCAPEEFVEEDCPYGFDVYGAACTWLRWIVPGLRKSEEDFFAFRCDVRDRRHDLDAWAEGAALRSAAAGDDDGAKGQGGRGGLPEGWADVFGRGEGLHAFRLIVEMMRYDPRGRPSASEALLHPYVNPWCREERGPDPPPRPWSLASHVDRWASSPRRRSSDEECQIFDWTDQAVSIELSRPVGLRFEEADVGTGGTRGGGVVVGGVEVDGSAGRSGLVRPGDSLLAIGPIDVEEATVEHVTELLEMWPKDTVSLQFLRR